MKFFRLTALAVVMLAPALALSALDVSTVEVSHYPTLQAAIDANPGRMIHLPEGEYRIDAALRITGDHSGLYGPARIVQTNPAAGMVVIVRAKGVRLENLSFTRSQGEADVDDGGAGIDAKNVRDLEISHVDISENHTHSSILVDNGKDITIEECHILDYKGRTIDDRTKSPLSGYAFKSIDGTGIQVLHCQGAIIRNNWVQEYRYLPTKELRDKYDLGKVTVVPAKPGILMSMGIWKSHYTSNWHQGAGIQVSGPENSERIILTGNIIDNAAQGMDIHSDYVVISSNIVNHAMIGMKAMHGAKHVLIDGNQFSYCDRWGVMVMPGAASHLPVDADATHKGQVENVDAGTIISNNIFSDFGFGNDYWNWPHPENGSDWPNVICVLGGQLKENPPIHNILITGNMVYDNAKDGILMNGKWVHPAPRYHYALYIEKKKGPLPVDVRAYGNMLDPGIDGATNYLP